MAGKTLTQADNGKTVAINLNDSITIHLDENGTTGYQWAVDKLAEDALTLQKSEFAVAGSSGLGGGGERTMIFKSKKVATVPIKLKYWREWEGDSSVVERFEVTIQIQN